MRVFEEAQQTVYDYSLLRYAAAVLDNSAGLEDLKGTTFEPAASPALTTHVPIASISGAR